MKKLFFFLGKGGVGKTTLAGSFASYLTNAGNNVFLASIDPAHNLFDFFGISPSKKPAQVTNNLTIEEFDIEHYLKKFLKESSQKMKNTYKYLQMINLENMFDILKHSPGMEEYAMLSALHELVTAWKEKVDYIVIDTPPTGLMLKTFALPKTTLLWLNKLKTLRKKILERRSQIVHVRGDRAFAEKLPSECEHDEIFKELETQHRLAAETWEILSNPTVSRKILVLNYDELSIREGTKIVTDLRALGIGIDLAVFNKKGMSDVSRKILDNPLETVRDIKRVEIPFFRETLTPRDKMLEIASNFAGNVL